MPCGHLPHLVHVRMAVYPSTRCAACDRRLTASDQASVGTFPLVTPEHLVLLRSTGQSPAVCIADWSRLRCATCGGNVYVEEIRTARLYPSGSWDDLERPRRGRPPKRIVAQRQVAALEGSGD